GVGLCSYLLIGFYFHRKSANDAANKAFIVNRIGDAGFLLGMFTIVWYFGTFRFTEITALARDPQLFRIGDPIITVACLLLFIGSGSVIHAMSGEQDMRNMGDLHRRIPVTHWTMFIATFAIAGIPPFAGFFSKDEILWQAWSSEKGAYWYLWLISYITALMTAFYMFRLMFLTFHGRPRMSHEAEHHIHESPKSMTGPLVVLAFFCLFAGFLGWPHSLGG